MLGFTSCCYALAVYVLFAGSFSASELGTGAVLALSSAVQLRIDRAISGHRFSFSLAHTRPWGRALAAVPGQTMATAIGLLRAICGWSDERGRADEQPFRLGEHDDAGQRARRASGVLAASLAPASYAVQVGPDRDRVLIHGIDRTPAAIDREWLA